MCDILELSGLFVCLRDLISFLVSGWTENIVGLWFARGISYQADTVCTYSASIAKLAFPKANIEQGIYKWKSIQKQSICIHTVVN